MVDLLGWLRDPYHGDKLPWEKSLGEHFGTVIDEPAIVPIGGVISGAKAVGGKLGLGVVGLGGGLLLGSLLGGGSSQEVTPSQITDVTPIQDTRLDQIQDLHQRMRDLLY